MAKELQTTNFNHICVRFDKVNQPMFLALVNQSLNKIHSKPIGEKLLDTIASTGKAQFGYKVCITRPDMRVRKDKGVIMVGGGNLARRGNEENACISGVGTVTMVRYNHNTIFTPDGARPNFIGLAHELVHALHNLAGDASSITKDEEYRTVGIEAFAKEEICENAIRAEHKVPLRKAYTGL